MQRNRFIAGTWILILLSFLSVIDSVVAAEKSCDALGRHLEQQKRQLAEYTDALRKLDDDQNPEMSRLLNHKINELIHQVRKSEEEMEECLDKGASEFSGSSTAGEPDLSEYAAMGCDQLQAMLIPLSITRNSLKRREHSLFSALTPEERQQLADAEKKGREVLAVLKKKCPEPSAEKDRSRRWPRR